MTRPYNNEPFVYDPAKHILGPLCKHNHEHEDTGLSIRYKWNKRPCCTCVRLSRRNLPKATKQRQKELQQQWRKDNPEATRAIQVTYAVKHKDALKLKNAAANKRHNESLSPAMRAIYNTKDCIRYRQATLAAFEKELATNPTAKRIEYVNKRKAKLTASLKELITKLAALLEKNNSEQ